MEIMGGSFNSAVLSAVNAARAENGNAPMALDGGLCAKALAHAKEMAERGEIYHPAAVRKASAMQPEAAAPSEQGAPLMRPDLPLTQTDQGWAWGA